jgi:hypothetical protein
MRIRFLLVSFTVLGLATAPSVQAQMFGGAGTNPFGGGNGGSGGGGGGGGGQPPPSKPNLPPALPGATAGNGAAPANHIPTDMEPTDALFDAINRGDINAARDAISRGADLHGQNVLGMSPLELSVDLGRNDISFMLLSMRGAESQTSQSATTLPPRKASSTKQAREVRPRSPAHVAAKAPAQAQTARLFSGDGGAPNPSAGFLGFDSGQR